MTETKIDTIKIKCNMSDPSGKLIPRGVMELLNVLIIDEVATFWFKDGKTTERFAKVAIELEKRRGAKDTVFFPRVQKAVTRYDGKTKEQIREIIVSQLKQMGVNAKEHGR